MTKFLDCEYSGLDIGYAISNLGDLRRNGEKLQIIEAVSHPYIVTLLELDCIILFVVPQRLLAAQRHAGLIESSV